MATAMLDHVDRFFGLPYNIGCFTTELGAGEAKGFWCWFEIVRYHPPFMNTIAKNNSRRASVDLLFIGAGCHLNLR